MHRTLLISLLSSACCLAGASAAQAAVVTFEDLSVFSGTSGNTDGQPGGQFYNGDSGNGSNTDGWTSGGATFSNSFSSDFGGFWSGWAYSNVVNSVTSGFGNQYASAAGGGSNGGVAPGQNYAIGFGSSSVINLPTGMRLDSVDVTNTTYTRLSMANGDSFAKQFGGASGNDPDFFQVNFTGFDALDGSGTAIGSVTVDLADFRFDDNSQDFILSDWSNVDLSSIAAAQSLRLSFASSDVGGFGINTPTYVAIDNLSLTAVPEPSSLGLLLGVALCGLHRRARRSQAQ